MDRDRAFEVFEMIREAQPALRGSESRASVERLEREEADIEAALDWLRRNGEAEIALELGALLQAFWFTAGRTRQGASLLVELLAAPETKARTPSRARAAFAAGELFFRQEGGSDQARSLYQEALSIAEELDDWQAVRRALVGLARATLRAGDYERVRALGERGRALAREHGDREAEWLPLHMQAASARMRGDHPRAWELYRESVALARELKNDMREAGELHNMGWLALHDGDPAQAKSLFRQAAEITLRLNSVYMLPYCVLDFAAVADAEGLALEAATLLGAAAARFQADGVVPDPDDQAEQERLIASVRAALSDQDFKRAWDEGAKLDASSVLGTCVG